MRTRCASSESRDAQADHGITCRRTPVPGTCVFSCATCVHVPVQAMTRDCAHSLLRIGTNVSASASAALHLQAALVIVTRPTVRPGSPCTHCYHTPPPLVRELTTHTHHFPADPPPAPALYFSSHTPVCPARPVPRPSLRDHTPPRTPLPPSPASPPAARVRLALLTGALERSPPMLRARSGPGRDAARGACTDGGEK